MGANLQELIDVLKSQCRLMTAMSSCLAAEREAVISGDREALNRQVALKESLVQQLKDAEVQRQLQVDALCPSLDPMDAMVTLKTLTAVGKALKKS